MKRSLSTLVLALLCMAGIAQQSYTAQLVKTLPQSPNAATLLKFIDAPVNYYTGIPTIDIPIYTLTSGKLSVPISLNYHAGGVKVEDVSSWVGLNWNLSAGGSIIRAKRGVIDENGYAAGAGIINTVNSMTLEQRYAYYQDVQNGLAESAPDIYSYSMPGESGKFFYSEQGQIVTKPRKRLQVNYGTFFGKAGWKIINLEGVQFYFLEIEESASNTSVLPAQPGSAATEVSAWQLSKIISPEGRDTVSFEYDTESQYSYSLLGATRYLNMPGTATGKQAEFLQSWNTVNAKLVKKISSNNGTITFYRSNDWRTDITSGKALDHIEIANRAGQVIRTVQFYTTTTTAVLNSNSYNAEANKRMYLDSIAFGGNNLSKVEVYKFSYFNRTSLPNRLSTNQDYWGYYNGKSNAQASLIPNCFADLGGTYTIVKGVDRDPDSTMARCGTLTRITYPTGGYTDYEYEGNQAANFNAVANLGYDILDTENNFYLQGDPLGVTTHYTGTFTIASGYAISNKTLGNITLGLPYATTVPPPPAGMNDPVVKLIMPNSSVMLLRSNRTNFVLPTGTYTVDVDFGGDPDPDMISNFFINITYRTGYRFNSAKNTCIPVGGLRVKKTRMTDPVTGSTIEKAFKYEWEDGSSTGILGSFPVYTGSINELNCSSFNNQYVTISSVSQSAAMMMQGAATGYSRVEEYTKNDGEAGKNTYYFSMVPDQAANQPFPYPPACALDEFRGTLLKQETYKKENSQYVKINEKSNNYDFVSLNDYPGDSLAVTSTGIQFGKNVFEPCDLQANNYYSYQFASYGTATGWSKLLSDTTRNFHDNGTTTEVVNSYQYSPNSLLLSKTTTRGSDGKYLYATVTYPSDYSIPGGSTDSRAKGILALQQQHRLSQPVEAVKLVSDDGIQEKAVAGLLTVFDETTAFPKSSFVLETATPLTNFSKAQYTGGSIVIDSRYAQRALFNQYTQAGNIAEQQMVQDQPQSILWDYSGQYPVAQAINSPLNKIAYTSFEAEAAGQWTFTPGYTILSAGGATGNKSYSGSLQSQTLPTDNYTVTLWSTSGTVTVNSTAGTLVVDKGTWKLYKWNLTNTSSVTVTGTNIDEVRLHPSNAQMVTYTYDPWIGPTSQSDPNNKVSFYEYDGYGRLKTIRDQDRNILKTFDYQYQANINQ